MLEGYTFLLVPLLLGWLLGKIKSLPKATASVLNFFVINIALPATVLLSIRNIELSIDLLIPAAAQWGALLVSAILVIAISRFLKFSRLVTGTLLLVVPLGNTAFLGLSIIPVFFGWSAVPYGVIYDQLGSFLALATYGAAIAGAYGTSNGISLKSLIVKILTFPPFVFLILGLLLTDVEIPTIISGGLSVLAGGLVPAAMLAIGLNVSFRINWDMFRPLLSALVIRLVIVPVIMLAVLYVVRLTGPAAQVSVFQSGMPSMITAAVLATDKGLDKKLATTIVSVGIVISLASLPLLYYLIELLLPT